MASESRSQTTSVAEKLFAVPQRFELAQAVRLLRLARRGSSSPGEADDPSTEPVRFRSEVSLGFPPSDISNLQEPTSEGLPARLTLPFFGVSSPASYGSLPPGYTEFVREESRRKNDAPRDFLDIFNHRATSLLVRSFEKHHPALAYERSEAPETELFERCLLALVGLGTPSSRHRLPVSDFALLRWAGLLSRGKVSEEGLESILAGIFHVPVNVESFIVKWHPLEPEDRSVLGERTVRLGLDAILGKSVGVAQSQIRLIVGPLRREEYLQFLPTGSGFRAMREVVRFATGGELDFEIRLVLKAREVPVCRLGAQDAREAPRLGWLAWLGTRERDRDASEVTLLETSRPPAETNSAQPSIRGGNS